MPFKKNFGFTLIELVIVIVILGILSATGLPKFIDLSSNAKGAMLQAIKGSLSTGVNLIQTKAIFQGKRDIVAAYELTFDGLTFTIYNQGDERDLE
jgi:MSHA pilin protein MshA